MLLHNNLGTQLRLAPTRFFLSFIKEILALVQYAPEIGPQKLTVLPSNILLSLLLASHYFRKQSMIFILLALYDDGFSYLKFEMLFYVQHL